MHRPRVRTKVGTGLLYKIIGDKAYVEFDYMYLVELDIKDVELKGINLASVEGGNRCVKTQLEK